MNKYLLLLILCFVLTKSFGQQNNFLATYSFDGAYTGAFSSGSEAITAENASLGGTKMGAVAFGTIGAAQVVQASVINNNASNYTNTFLKLNLKPKTGYTFVITNVKVTQSTSANNTSQVFRIGVNQNGAIPNTTNTGESTANIANTTTLSQTNFVPSTTVATGQATNYVTVWLSARGLATETFNWNIDQIEISGTYQLDTPEAVNITVNDTPKQLLRFGIDAERLWYWRTGTMGNTLANLGVKELKASFVRVAIDCAYEREEGVKVPANYDKILDMMLAMKTANPEIEFFASPRPLDEAYTDTENEAIWGGPVAPWAPVPAWIMTWVENGTNADGTKKWRIGTINVGKLAQYYADYLNFMHQKGFKITYMDVTNEKNEITPTMTKYLFDNIPGLLNTGVHMPKLIAPSSWSYESGTEYLNSFTNAQLGSFGIAGCHNTGDPGTAVDFTTKANQIAKEPWNTELHKWVGINTRDEVLNAEAFLNAMNGGFTGLCSWLFYGPSSGKDHTMIWSGASTATRSAKYEIYKKVVNNTNGGNLYKTVSSSTGVFSATFVKDSVMIIVALNKDVTAKSNVKFLLQNKNLKDLQVEVTKWQHGIAKAGVTSTFDAKLLDQFEYTLDSSALYVFKIDFEKRKPFAGLDQINKCAGSSTLLTGTLPTTGTWRTQSGNPVGATISNFTTNEATVTFDASASGLYKFIYTANTRNDTMSVFVKAKPNAASDLNEVLAGNSVVLTGTNPTSGTWTADLSNNTGSDLTNTASSGVSTATFTLSSGGLYSYIYSSNGCSDTLSVNVIDIDTDNDGILNTVDADMDGDAINNIFDTDIDGDGIDNATDNDDDADALVDSNDTIQPNDANGFGVINDNDNDGVADTSDLDLDGDGIPNSTDTDIDNDGIINATDTDDDGDNVLDVTDITLQGPVGADTDNDGVLDAIENTAPNGGDGNNDGILDKDQTNVTTLPLATGSGFVTGVFTLGAGCTTPQVMYVKPETQIEIEDSEFNYPAGLVGFSAKCGSTVNVKYYWHGLSAVAGFRMFGKTTPGEGNNVFFDFTSAVIVGSEIINNTAIPTTIHTITDGQKGDLSAIDGFIFDPAGPAIAAGLSVKLLSFSGAKAGEDKIKIDWKSADEVNNDYYVLERSKDAQSFEPIDKITTNKTGFSTYSFLDNNSLKGSNYYRLKIVGTKGEITYSAIINVINDSKDDIEYYPNPSFNNSIRFTEKGGFKINTIHVITANGSILKTLKPVNNEIDISTLPKGNYVIEATDLNKRKVVKRISKR